MCQQRLYLGAVMAIVGGISMAIAQPVNFTCPRAGVIEQRGLGKLQYTGPAANDPLVCNYMNYKNEPDARLFNFYPIENSSVPAVKAGLGDLFAGRKTSVTFDYTSPTRYLSHDTWTIQRRQPVTIAGRTVDTVVLVLDRQYEGRNQSHWHLVEYLDIKDGLWVKGESSLVSGQTNGMPPSYQDHDITVP
jgi:hypothetical protein